MPEDVLDLAKRLRIGGTEQINLLKTWMMTDHFTLLTLEGVDPTDPLFTAALQEMQANSVDVLNVGTSRILDDGMTGLSRTMDALESNGILPVGAYRTPQQRIPVVTYNTHPVAFLSYVQEVSEEGIENSSEAERAYAVKMLDPDQIRQDVEWQRALGAHLVIVNINWADELPDNYRTLLDQIVRSGADIIIGTHPEMVEPLELRSVWLNDGTLQSVLLASSLGNFLAGESTSAPDTAGILLSLTYVYDEDLARLVLNTDSMLDSVAQYAPTWLAYDQESEVYRVIPAGLRTKPYWMTNDVYEVMHAQYAEQVTRLGYSPATPVAE